MIPLRQYHKLLELIVLLLGVINLDYRKSQVQIWFT